MQSGNASCGSKRKFVNKMEVIDEDKDTEASKEVIILDSPKPRFLFCFECVCLDFSKLF